MFSSPPLPRLRRRRRRLRTNPLLPLRKLHVTTETNLPEALRSMNK
jgi:hypothetical protein